MLNESRYLPAFRIKDDGLLSRIEARTKIAFVILALVLNILVPGTGVSLGIIALVCAGFILARVPAGLAASRMTLPLLMATVLMLTEVFFYGQTPLFHLDFFGLAVTGYTEGLAQGTALVLRVLAGVSLVLLLGLTTPADRLLKACSWFRVPPAFIEVSLLVYRYIFVLWEELAAVREAQRTRLAYRTWRSGMDAAGMLGASVILRAYDRSSRVFEAMCVRGYCGRPTGSGLDFSPRDAVTAVLLAAVLAGLYLAGRAV
jgi:cobalt ECF transporter T component CbiQ